MANKTGGPKSDNLGDAAREAVEKAAADALATVQPRRKKGKKAPVMGPVRANLEAFGVAILGAVLLKWFCLEAFQIPTSSMQPTLMGSSEAGIYDRLLVDKFSPAWRDPQRWDVTVFSYPLQKNQNYVKRLVGMPGEKLRIAGGNLYVVEEKDGRREHRILRKPERIQAGLWKEVFPARMLVRGEPKALGNFFSAFPGTAWIEGDELGSFTAQLDGSPTPRRLKLIDRTDGGFVDLVWDGYPTDWSRAIREQAGGGGREIVPDAWIEATFTPDDTIDELSLEVEVNRPDHDQVTFALHVKDGKGCLHVRGKDPRPVLESGRFVCELPAGVATTIGFAHIDDELIAWLDGDEKARLDVAAHHCRDGCELAGQGSTPEHCAVPQIQLKGREKVRVDGLRVCRDLHYVRTCGPGIGTATLPPDALIEIPEGHYFMMGDNTLQSIDSRGWTALSLGVLPDGTVVKPEQAADVPGARILRGNKRTVSPQSPPDRDETPVVIKSRDLLAMIDEFGDVHALKARVSRSFADQPDHGNADFMIEDPTAPDGRRDWKPPEKWVPFVPREHIRGRALVIFWRWPLPRLSPIK
jgi:signal peptidase I